MRSLKALAAREKMEAMMVNTVSDETSLGAMDPYGVRAMHYVRDHCPVSYEAITDPIGFFSALGAQLRDEVAALEPTLVATGPAPTAHQSWDEAVGRANMARLMAEETVFSEFYQAMLPEEIAQDDETWEPLMPDMADIAQAEAEGI